MNENNKAEIRLAFTFEILLLSRKYMPKEKAKHTAKLPRKFRIEKTTDGGLDIAMVKKCLPAKNNGNSKR